MKLKAVSLITLGVVGIYLTCWVSASFSQWWASPTASVLAIGTIAAWAMGVCAFMEDE